MTTIYDIAKEAGVSPATVSNAFNRPEQMKAETRQRILDVADRLGYRPNVAAQALARGRTKMVGLLVADIRVPIISNATRGIEDKLAQEGYLPIIASTDGDSDKTLELLNNLDRHGACGYIIVPARYGVSGEVINKLESLQQSGVPTIVSGHDIVTDRINNINMGSQNASKELVQYLIDLGHRDIAFITSYYSKGRAIRRWLGFQEAMLENHVPIRPELVIECDYTPQASLEAMEQLMALEKPPTAVFAMTDIYMRGIIDYIAKYQINVPEELSIVSFDYQALAQRTTPAVTSIVISTYELGWKTAELFVDIMKDPTVEARHEKLDYKLEIRETTGPPKSRN